MFAKNLPSATTLLSLAASLWVIPGCDVPEGDSDAPPCTSCALQDANNYTYAADLSIGTFSLKEGEAFTLDWSGLTTDIHGAAMDPAADVVRITLAVFLTLTPDEIAEGLTTDTLQQADITLFTTCYPDGATQCGLEQFSVLGSSPDLAPFFLEGNGNWLVALTGESMSLAYGMAILQPSATSTETTAYIDSDTSALDLTVDLGGLTPLAVPSSTPALSIDWSALTRDGLGQPFDASAVDEVLVGRYEEDLDALEEKAWDLESIAAESWSLSTHGDSAISLTDLEGDRPFPGVDTDATWLLALRCTTCVNPAPPFLTVLTAP